MKRTLGVAVRLVLACLCVLALNVSAHAQTGPSSLSRVAGRFVAGNYAAWRGATVTGNTGTGSQTITISPAIISLPDGRQVPLFTIPGGSGLPPLTIDFGATQETVTPTAASVVNCPNGTVSGCVNITASFTYAHPASSQSNIMSGTYGLQEAIDDAFSQGGGIVTIGREWYNAGGTTTMLTAALPFWNVSVEDVSSGVPRYWNGTPTGAALAVPATLTAQAACDSTHQTCSDASVAGSASWSGTVFAAVAYMDCFGNEGPPSLTASWTSVVSKAINIASPAASTGACGWVPYLSLSGGTYAQAYQIPPTSTVCTLSTLTPVPSCAITNAKYGTTASVYGTTALFTVGGAQIVTYPVNTGQHFTQLGSTAMTAASQTPISNSSVTYSYAPSNRVASCGISSANVVNYAASGSSATTIPNAIATWTIPANCFNYIGAEYRVSGKFTYTDGGDSSTKVRVMWDAAGTNTTTVPTVLCDMADTATGTAAAYNGTYSCTIKTATTGATGTALVNGYSTQSLAAGATTLVRNTADIAVAASGSINLTVPARVVVYFIGTGATNNPGAQGLAATLELLN